MLFEQLRIDSTPQYYGVHPITEQIQVYEFTQILVMLGGNMKHGTG